MEFLKKLGMVVIVVAKEDHHETEGKHLHAYGEIQNGISKEVEDEQNT